MPLRSNRTFSLVKSKKNAEDACVLRVVRPIEDSVYNLSVSYNRSASDDTSYRDRSYSLNNPSKARWTTSTSYSTIGHSDHQLKSLIEDEVKMKKEKGSLDSQSLSSDDQENLPQNSESTTLLAKESSPVNTKAEPQSKCPLGLRKHQRHKSLSSVSPTFNFQSPDSEFDPYRTIGPLRVIEEQQSFLISGNCSLMSGRSQKSIEEELLKVAKSAGSIDYLKDFHATRNSASGSKKAGKIQKTIRALYDSNTVKKIPSDRSGSEMDQLKVKSADSDSSLGSTRLEIRSFF